MIHKIYSRRDGTKVLFEREGTSLREVVIAAVAEKAYLRDADLSGATLRYANLRGANLSDVPTIPNIHQAVYQAANAPQALDMSDWHTCDTTHCRGGWVITLAGEEGKKLEQKIGTAAAAALIYLKSDPNLEKVPSFHCSNDAAMEDMKRLAEIEAGA